jgi:hypothetical protein
MLCLALRSEPARVYQRALRQFSVVEITEAFAATRGLTMPSQLRHLLRERGRDRHEEFLNLLPTRSRAISIQRWSVRRVGLALLVLLGLVVVIPMVVSWSVQTDRVDTSLYARDVDCDSREPLWLMAQAVPSASLVPCVPLLPVGWTLADVKVQDGRARISFDTDRAGAAAVVVELTASCDLAGAVELSSEQRTARRYLRVERTAAEVSLTVRMCSRAAASPSGSSPPRRAESSWPARHHSGWGSPLATSCGRCSASAPAAGSRSMRPPGEEPSPMTQACADGTQDPAADPPDPPGDCVGHVRDPQAYLPGRASMGCLLRLGVRV